MSVDRAVVSTDGQGESSAPMYQQIGGAVVVTAVVDRLYMLIGEDVLLRRYFDRVDMLRQKRHMAALLSQMLGRPRHYQGRDLAEVHRSLGISGEHYERVGNYLLASLLIVHAPHDAPRKPTPLGSCTPGRPPHCTFVAATRSPDY